MRTLSAESLSLPTLLRFVYLSDRSHVLLLTNKSPIHRSYATWKTKRYFTRLWPISILLVIFSLANWRAFARGCERSHGVNANRSDEDWACIYRSSPAHVHGIGYNSELSGACGHRRPAVTDSICAARGEVPVPQRGWFGSWCGGGDYKPQDLFSEAEGLRCVAVRCRANGDEYRSRKPLRPRAARTDASGRGKRQHTLLSHRGRCLATLEMQRGYRGRIGAVHGVICFVASRCVWMKLKEANSSNSPRLSCRSHPPLLTHSGEQISGYCTGICSLNFLRIFLLAVAVQ